MNLIPRDINTLKNSGNSKPKLKLWHKLLFLSPILIIILIFKGNEWYKDYRLDKYGKECYATITQISMSGVRDPFEVENIAFEFNVGNSIYIGYAQAETNNHYAFAENGLPLSVGDKYKIRYDFEDPELYRLNLMEPDLKTLTYYFKQAACILRKNDYFTNLKDSERSISCFVQNVFMHFGYDGIATILFHEEYLAENISHNAIVYRQFFEKEEVKELIRKCSE